MADTRSHYEFLQERKASVLRRNPHLFELITGYKDVTTVPLPPLPPVAPKPMFPRGRYVPRTLDDLIILVAKLSDQHPLALSGNGRTRKIVDARSCVAVLALKFAPRQSPSAIDDALLRGVGTARWHRERHADRLKLYPEYAALYARCLEALEARP